jgi:hypothetical protein
MIRKNRKKDEEEFCPFLNQNCIKTCAVYDKFLNGCSIRIGAYNVYRLTQAIKEWNEQEENG